jgi:hypothetical protein
VRLSPQGGRKFKHMHSLFFFVKISHVLYLQHTRTAIPVLKEGVTNSVAEPHHFNAAAAPAPDKNFNAAPAAPSPAPALTLLYSKAKFLK